MTTQRSSIVVAAAVVLTGAVCAQAQAQGLDVKGWRSQHPSATSGATAGAIASVVRDSGGSPVVGAIVSAVGGRTAVGTTDADGRCTLSLPAGEYLLRVHRIGFGSPNSMIVRVRSGAIAAHDVVLTPIATARKTDAPHAETQVLAAGFMAGASTIQTIEREVVVDEIAVPGEGDHDHSETAWRLRHIRRSVLKDSIERVRLDDAGGEFEDGGAAVAFGRVMTAPARAAVALLADVPFTGSVNLLTSGALDAPGHLFSGSGMAHGVAYLSLGAAAGDRGDWLVRAGLTEGDVASWTVAGSFLSRGPGRHRYETGMLYAVQSYAGSNPASIAAVEDGSRTAGAVFAYDNWTLSPVTTLSYGARYARYGYLADGLLSPRAQLQVGPMSGWTVTVAASHRAEAPGADEFDPGVAWMTWLPPERTFSPLTGTRFMPTATRTYEVGLARELSSNAAVAVRTFRQRTHDQVTTLFGLDRHGAAIGDNGHYFLASAGDVTARGWSVRIDQVVGGRVRGSIDYSITSAEWQSSGESAMIAVFAPSVVRTGSERLHDLTASIDAQVPQTATRVFAMYRVNTGYAGTRVAELSPALAARFDVQVTQSLPFLNFTSAQWEMLLGIRNMFRELDADGSMYDELLVVRPPKRIVGGLTVRF
jgi:hypothetical protein